VAPNPRSSYTQRASAASERDSVRGAAGERNRQCAGRDVAIVAERNPPRSLGTRRRQPPPDGYISMERMERSAISSTERGTIPRTTTTIAETDRASEKRIRGGRGTETSPSAGVMYM